MSNPLQDKIEGLRKPILKYGEYRHYTLEEALEILNALKAAYSENSQLSSLLELLLYEIIKRNRHSFNASIDNLFSYYDSHLKDWSVDEIESLRKTNTIGECPSYTPLQTDTILDVFANFIRKNNLDDKELRELIQNIYNTFMVEDGKSQVIQRQICSFHVEKLFDYFEVKYGSKRELKE